jgi:hypothetical protein
MRVKSTWATIRFFRRRLASKDTGNPRNNVVERGTTPPQKAAVFAMPDFGYGGYRHGEFRREEFHRRHHHHHPYLGELGYPAPPMDLDPIASAMDPDMGCDPSSPGFRVFGDDGDATSTDNTAPDDGSGGQGGVLDAVSQVAQGVSDMIAPSAPPEAYMPGPVPFHHRHHRFYPRGYDPRFLEHERLEHERERLRRIEHFRRLEAERRGRFFGFDLPQPPGFRYGPTGYRPRGAAMDMRRAMQHGHGGYGPNMHHGHHHPHHHRGGFPGGPGGFPGGPGQGGGNQSLPPGSYRASCQGCSYDGQTLNCQCKDFQGNFQPASVQVQQGVMGMPNLVTNNNGVLTTQQGF